jgi:glycosyltransferase involved in cell wall biosynthesis
MNGKLRVAYLIDTIEPNFGGTETQLVRLLERIDRQQFQPYLCFLRDSAWFQNNRDLVPQVNVDFRSFYSLTSWKNFFRFVRFLRDERVDVLQTQFRDSNILGTFAAKLAGIGNLIGTRRNQGYWLNRVELLILRLLNPLADYFIVNSGSVQKYVETVERVSSRKIERIYNGVILDAFRDDPDEARRTIRGELGIPDGAPVVVLVGNLRPVKGIDVLLNAIGSIHADFPAARVIVVGEGDERTALTELRDRLNLTDTVQLIGNRKDVPRVLMASDIGVLSSHSEGLSNAIIEYMAAGLPVVCTDVGGNTEMVEDEVNGFVVPAGDSAAMAAALAKLLSDPERARTLGQRGQRRAEDMFDINRCVERTQALYRRLAGVPQTQVTQ